MAGRNVREMLKRYGSTRGNYFSLKDHGDKAQVRLLYDHPEGEDLDYYVIHDLNAGKEGTFSDYVLCPEDSCPLCESGVNKARLMVFMQLLDFRDNKLKVFVRNDKYLQKLLAIIERYGPLVERPFEIERVGRKGDTKTTYEFFHFDKDGKTLKDFPPRIDMLNKDNGGLIRKLTTQQLLTASSPQDDLPPEPAPTRTKSDTEEDPFF